MKEEIWKDVVGYEGLYEVSNMGKVRSISRKVVDKNGKRITFNEKLKTLHTDDIGRVSTQLWKNNKMKNKRVHILVLEAFDGPRPEGMEGCHNDGNPSNNKHNNLRWDTPINNAADKKIHGTYHFGETVNGSKLTESDVRAIKEILDTQEWRQHEIANWFGVDQAIISRIHTGKIWGHIQLEVTSA